MPLLEPISWKDEMVLLDLLGPEEVRRWERLFCHADAQRFLASRTLLELPLPKRSGFSHTS
jgi:hypothetical protein